MCSRKWLPIMFSFGWTSQFRSALIRGWSVFLVKCHCDIVNTSLNSNYFTKLGNYAAPSVWIINCEIRIKFPILSPYMQMPGMENRHFAAMITTAIDTVLSCGNWLSIICNFLSFHFPLSAYKLCIRLNKFIIVMPRVRYPPGLVFSTIHHGDCIFSAAHNYLCISREQV